MKLHSLSKRPLNAIYEEDLINFLETHNLLEPLRKGQLKCAVCGKVLNLNNIGAFIQVGEEFKIVCRNPSCMMIALTQEDRTN